MIELYKLKLTVWLSMTVTVALVAVSYLFLHAEVRDEARISRGLIERQNMEIVELKNTVLLMRNQQSAQCKQYESDMDRFFRDHPEYKQHLWICRVE